jgi:hypothetical protein
MKPLVRVDDANRPQHFSVRNPLQQITAAASTERTIDIVVAGMAGQGYNSRLMRFL